MVPAVEETIVSKNIVAPLDMYLWKYEITIVRYRSTFPIICIRKDWTGTIRFYDYTLRTLTKCLLGQTNQKEMDKRMPIFRYSQLPRRIKTILTLRCGQNATT